MCEQILADSGIGHSQPGAVMLSHRIQYNHNHLL
jgi:hypothetical protein